MMNDRGREGWKLWHEMRWQLRKSQRISRKDAAWPGLLDAMKDVAKQHGPDTTLSQATRSKQTKNIPQKLPKKTAIAELPRWPSLGALPKAPRQSLEFVMFGKLRQTTPFIRVLKSRVLSKKKFLQTLKLIGCRNRNTQLKFPQFRVLQSHCKWIPRNRNLPTRTTSKPPSWSSPQTRCKRWILQQCLSDKWQQMTTEDRRRFGWWKLHGDSQRYSHAIHKTSSLLVRELFVLFDPLLQRWICKHQSMAAGALSFEVVMFHSEDVWKRVADFVSRRKWAVSWVQRQIRQVIRASRSWICCSTPKWDYFAMFFVVVST